MKRRLIQVKRKFIQMKLKINDAKLQLKESWKLKIDSNENDLSEIKSNTANFSIESDIYLTELPLL